MIQFSLTENDLLWKGARSTTALLLGNWSGNSKKFMNSKPATTQHVPIEQSLSLNEAESYV